MIRAIRLHDFRGFEDATFEPITGVNLLVAGNDRGKTTARAGLEYALAGRAYGFTDERGAGAESMIRTGAKQAIIELLVTGRDGETFGVRRTIYASSTPTKVEVQGVAGSTNVQEKVLAERLGCGPDVVSIALNSSRFLDRPAAEQQAAILRLLRATWTAEEIAAAMESHLARRALALIGCEKTAGGPEALTAIEKRAREVRPAEKRTRDTLAAELAALPAGKPMPPAAKADADARIAAAQADRDGIQQAAGAAALLASSVKRLESQSTILRADMAKLDGQIAGYKQGPTVEAAQKAEVEAKAAADRDAERVANLSASFEAARQDVANWEDVVAALEEGTDGTCPFCPEVTCGVDVGKARAALVAGLTTARGKLAELAPHLTAVKESAAKSAAASTAAHEARVSAEGRRDALASAIDQRAAKEQALRGVDADLKQAKAKVSGASADERLAELDRQIAADRGLLSAHERAVETEASRADLTARHKAAEENVHALDDLCDEFKPGGVRTRLLQPLLEGFLNDVNGALGGFADARVVLGEDGGVEVEGAAWTGRLRPAALSRSLRLRVGVAIQYAICRAAGLPLMLVDDADALDHSNRNLLLQLLLQIAPDFGQVIVLAAQPTADLPPDPGVDGLAFWTIADGQVVRLQPAASEVSA